MKNKKLILIFLLVGILIVAGTVYYKNKIEWQHNPVKVIEKSFEFKNKHDYDEYKKCYKYPDYIQKDSLDNIKSIKILYLDKVKDENQYKAFIDGNNIDKKNVEIYKVKYNVKFKDASKTPIDNGEDEIDYILVKDKNSKWKIDSWGR